MTQSIVSLVRNNAFAFASAACFGAFGMALLLQHALGMEPCPLCIVQRYFILLCAGVSLLAWAFQRSSLGLILSKGLVVLAALGGAATSLRHMWVQANPQPSQGCLPGLDYMLEQMPLSQMLPLLFKGSADCSVVDTLAFGVTLPQASLAVFTLTLALAIAARGRAQ